MWERENRWEGGGRPGRPAQEWKKHKIRRCRAVTFRPPTTARLSFLPSCHYLFLPSEIDSWRWARTSAHTEAARGINKRCVYSHHWCPPPPPPGQPRDCSLLHRRGTNARRGPMERQTRYYVSKYQALTPTRISGIPFHCLITRCKQNLPQPGSKCWSPPSLPPWTTFPVSARVDARVSVLS